MNKIETFMVYYESIDAVLLSVNFPSWHQPGEIFLKLRSEKETEKGQSILEAHRWSRHFINLIILPTKKLSPSRRLKMLYVLLQSNTNLQEQELVRIDIPLNAIETSKEIEKAYPLRLSNVQQRIIQALEGIKV